MRKLTSRAGLHHGFAGQRCLAVSSIVFLCILVSTIYIQFFDHRFETVHPFPMAEITGVEHQIHHDAEYCSDLYSKHTIPRWKDHISKRNEIGYDHLHCDDEVGSNEIIPFRIFQIGFHRVGTNSLQQLFSKNGYGSAHYECKTRCYLDAADGHQQCEHEPCSRLMQRNLLNDRLPLDGFCHEYAYYGDFGISPMINDVDHPIHSDLPYDLQFDLVHDQYTVFWYEVLDRHYPV